MGKANRAVRVTIIGLGRVGTSIGLALKQSTAPVYIVGHDREPEQVRKALRLRAIDEGEWNLPRSVEGTDLVVLAVPFSELADTFRYIAQDLRENAVVMDTASVKEPVLRWATEILPAQVHFVGGHPIVRDVHMGQEHASADLFRDEIFALCPAPEVNAKAVQLVTDMVTALGAQPLFLDAVEHDSMMAAVEHLPQLLALALGRTVMGEPSWREMRKLAGGQFEAATFWGEGDPKAVVAQLMANRERVLQWLEMLRRQLAWWQQQLQALSHEPLEEAVQPLFETRSAWLTAAMTKRWERPEEPVTPMSFADWLFGQTFVRRWRQKPSS